MNHRIVSLVLILPLFFYLGYLLVTQFTGWDVLNESVFAFVVVLNVIQLTPWKGRWITLSGLWTMVIFGIIGSFAFSLLGGMGLDISAGIILASPFLMETWVWQTESSPGRRIAALQFAFLDGVMIVAALNWLTSSGYKINSESLIASYAQVNMFQLNGLANLLNLPIPFSSLTATLLPLQTAMTPAFVILGGLALVGVFAPLLRPQTATGAILPFQGKEPTQATLAYNPELEHVSPRITALFPLQTSPRAPPYGKLPGIAVIVATGTLTLIFVVTSLYWPAMVLLPTILALAVVLGLVLLMTRSSLKVPRYRSDEEMAVLSTPLTPPVPATPIISADLDSLSMNAERV